MNTLRMNTLGVFACAALSIVPVWAMAQNAVPVTVGNFTRAESDLYMGNSVKEGGLGRLIHRREPAFVENQLVIRLNRDTLYSSGVFDLEAGPVTITDAERRQALYVASGDQRGSLRVRRLLRAGSHTLTRQNVGTRYILAAIRTLVDPNDRTGPGRGS